jgi:hypothetical protein
MGEPLGPQYRTGWLWAVLTILLTVGTAASAFVVYGLTDLAATGRWVPDLIAVLVGGGIAGFSLLLIAGMLYRVDRLRGVPHRRVSLFE